MKAEADFPHGLRIEVIEHTPVAVPRHRRSLGIPVTGGGHLLRGLQTGRPSGDPGGRPDPTLKTLAALAIAAAAPPLREPRREDPLEPARARG